MQSIFYINTADAIHHSSRAHASNSYFDLTNLSVSTSIFFK